MITPRLKVLIVPSWYPSTKSPVNGIFVHEQAKVLSKAYDVRVLVPEWSGWRTLIARKAGARSSHQQHDGINVYRERAFVPIPRSARSAYQQYLKAVYRGFDALVAAGSKPDVIHAHVVLPAGWAATQLGKRYNIPTVLTEHSSPFSMHLVADYQRGLVRETLRQVDRVVAISPAMAEQIRAFCDIADPAVIGEVIKTDFFVPATTGQRPPDGPARFLTVALLSAQKGIQHLLKAGQILLERGISTFELAIGGDGPDRASLEQQAHALGLADRCHFLGLLTQDKVREQMQQCHAFVLPSLHETFGIVLGEAMACGKAVIATRCGGPEFVVTPETGVLVDVADPGALADAMEGFIVGQFQYDPQSIRDSVRDRFGEIAFLQRISALYSQVLA